MKRSTGSIFALVLITFVFLFVTSLTYAQAKKAPGPKGGPGAGQHKKHKKDMIHKKHMNPPGPKGGPGAGPKFRKDKPPMPTDHPHGKKPMDHPQGKKHMKHKRKKAIVDAPWEAKADANNDGVVDQVEKNQWNKRKPKRPVDGEPGIKPINPPGPKGGPGAGPKFKKGNPPGLKGGPGAGPKGGKKAGHPKGGKR